ncbi:Uncharacterized membrane protein [Sphingomonas gellani]|uniref:Uncharacterized membrane protein n=1 Tax=Sphingomonas gellani TaxID=1166340 RepID=A0A1H8IZ26_9SPHN|nr:DUF2306 domain-containing protein [Sphingomonas gellani]SEN73296.1 Uncharacterized membrane protein [Sphingomonas gellani]
MTLSTTIASTPPFSPARRDRTIVALGAVSGGAILLALAHGMTTGAVARGLSERGDIGPWLVLHLVSVIPALPLGGYVLLRRKGDATHRMLGRLWAGLMLMAALSSFGLRGMTGSFSVIHLLSILVLVMIPRGVMQAMRRDIAAHQRTMALTYLGLAVAGFFTLLPGRLIGGWLFG